MCKIYGSSPQAWGTGLYYPRSRGRNRFIPTGMGNSCTTTNLECSETVHPHRHGEQRSCCRPLFANTGSSPQAWGTERVNDCKRTFMRFIPTGMGNRSWGVSGSGIASVHPHRHGEQDVADHNSARRYGSSPQAWGTVARISRQLGAWRFIPTGMGNSA